MTTLGRKIRPANNNRPVNTSAREEERAGEGGIDCALLETLMRYFLILMLAGCATKHYGPEDTSFTIEHGTVRFGSAYSEARAHCEKLGMKAKHLGTNETGFYMVSRFECY